MDSLVVTFIWSDGDLKAEKIVLAIWEVYSGSLG